ncbi:MAG: hypothetical protein IBX57_00755 [Gammaproteobacteria bacterium]|nr:hypothetical protein [Gammaproteobacteria bacterium]
MSLLKINGKKNTTPLNELVLGISQALTERGSELVTAQYSGQVASLESLSPSELETINTAAGDITGTIESVFANLADNGRSLGFESLSPQQLEAGVMIALASKDPSTYAKAAMSNKAQPGQGINVISFETSGSAGSLDYRDEPSMEAFDAQEMSNMIPYSIAFNVQASRQDDFGEAFYPTVVVSPDVGGIDISVNRTTVFNAVKHATTGKTTNFDQKNLLEAVVNSSILADESTALVPFVQPNGENEDKFVAETDVAPYTRTVAGVDITTAPLKIGTEVDLLGISQHPQLTGAGVIDHTDAIDPRMFVSNVYLKAGNATDGFDVMKFNVSRLPRNAFLKSIEGVGREMSLNFTTEALVLNAETTNLDGSQVGVLTEVRTNNYSVRLKVVMSGTAHVEFGSVQVMAPQVTVVGIANEDGEAISTVTGAGASIKASLEGMQVIGYELGASRTNSNRRTRGLLLNNNTETERFAIPLGAPISAPSPTGSNRDASDLESLITAARIRNSNNAVTTLLNYGDTLRAFVENRRLGHGSTQIEGIGRHVVVPFYEEVNLDLTTVVNSTKSKERAEDISHALINVIRDVVYRMYRNSGYQAALDASSVGSKKPTLLVGTDSIIQRHLMVEGDTRTFGIAFEDSDIVTSFDARMDGKIVLTFTRKGGAGQADALSFGTHAWMPELATSMQVNREGAMYKESMVQPRSRHINNLPVMAIINVTGLKDVMTTKIKTPALDA